MTRSEFRLTGDAKWPASTPVPEAIGVLISWSFRVNQLSSYLRYVGPLAGAFPILSLRTSKADVVVGVDHAKADALDASGEKWRVNGKSVKNFLAF